MFYEHIDMKKNVCFIEPYRHLYQNKLYIMAIIATATKKEVGRDGCCTKENPMPC